MKRETLEKAIELHEDILLIERMSTVMTTGRRAYYFTFHEGGYADDLKGKNMTFSERMTTKMISLLQEYKLELERQIEAL